MNNPLVFLFISYLTPALRRVHDPQHEVRTFRPRPRAAHALLFDRVVAFPHARRIQQRHRIAAEIEMHLDHVARGPRMGRDDRGLAPRQPIEQARFAGIRRPGDRHHQPLPQPLAAMFVAQRFLNLFKQFPRSMKCGRNQVLRDIRLVGKIDPRLDQRERADQLLPPGFGALPEQALKLPHRLRALRFGLGEHQIGKALDGGEIEPAVLERAAGELAGLGGPKTPAACRALRARPPPPPCPRAGAARPCPRRFRCWVRETTAPAPRRAPRRVPGLRKRAQRRAARLGQLAAERFSASPRAGR